MNKMDDAEDTEDINQRISKCFTNIMTSLNTEDEECIFWNKQILNLLLKYEKEYEEINKEVETLSNKCKDLKLDCKDMCGTLNEKKIELEKNKTEMKKLDSVWDSLMNEYTKIDQECMKTKKKMELTTFDENVLNLSRKKLQLYDQSNIFWDYSVPLSSSTITGYIRNKDKNIIKAFEFKRNELSSSELKEKLWKEIELGSGEDWSDIVAMTDLRSDS